MPRSTRSFIAGEVYHVLNRGNGRSDIFHKEADFLAFLKVLAEGLKNYPVDLLCWCLMNNHWHLVLRPRRSGAISDLMRWIGVTHVRRHHAHYATRGGGHIYQGRFKSFAVQDDLHFLIVCRYLQANPRRAGMVNRAEKWRWSSLGYSPIDGLLVPLSEWPVDRPQDWMELVNQAMPKRQLERLRTSVKRGTPYGDEKWTLQTARKLGLMHAAAGGQAEEEKELVVTPF
jgi:putative transposase